MNQKFKNLSLEERNAIDIVLTHSEAIDDRVAENVCDDYREILARALESEDYLFEHTAPEMYRDIYGEDPVKEKWFAEKLMRDIKARGKTPMLRIYLTELLDAVKTVKEQNSVFYRWAGDIVAQYEAAQNG